MQIERQTEPIEVSVVIPCLNEEDTLASCIEKAQQALREHNIAGEIVVADNGSTDLSRTIAERQGARVDNRQGARLWQCTDGRDCGGDRPIRHHGGCR